ncbi:MAG: AMP-binding protein, partial [Candidatus Komeilibacteria bacterium]
MTTIFSRFKEVAARYSANVFVADIRDNQIYRQTYSEVLEKVQRVSAALRSLGLIKGDRLALLLPNSSDWVIVDLACAQLGLIDVPIHTTYSWHYIKYTIEHSGSSALVIDNFLWQKYSEQISQLGLKHIIVRANEVSAPAITLNHCFEQPPLLEAEKLAETDVHTIVYTSGTTAEPKGVMLTHQNMLFDTDSARQILPIDPTDSFFSFLPLSHMMERTGCYYTALSVGASVYFCSDKSRIINEIKLVRPTIMLAVPRIFEKMDESIFDKIDAGPVWKKKIFFSAMQFKPDEHSIISGIIGKFYDMLVFHPILQVLGGRLRFVVSGGASLDRRIARFFQTVGITILEGYGLTECSPIVALNPLSKRKIGSVGLPLPGVEVKIS